MVKMVLIALNASSSPRLKYLEKSTCVHQCQICRQAHMQTAAARRRLRWMRDASILSNAVFLGPALASRLRLAPPPFLVFFSLPSPPPPSASDLLVFLPLPFFLVALTGDGAGAASSSAASPSSPSSFSSLSLAAASLAS